MTVRAGSVCPECKEKFRKGDGVVSRLGNEEMYTSKATPESVGSTFQEIFVHLRCANKSP